jgi:hypothetical protein
MTSKHACVILSRCLLRSALHGQDLSGLSTEGTGQQVEKALTAGTDVDVKDGNGCTPQPDAPRDALTR